MSTENFPWTGPHFEYSFAQEGFLEMIHGIMLETVRGTLIWGEHGFPAAGSWFPVPSERLVIIAFPGLPVGVAFDC